MGPHPCEETEDVFARPSARAFSDARPFQHNDFLAPGTREHGSALTGASGRGLQNDGLIRECFRRAATPQAAASRWGVWGGARRIAGAAPTFPPNLNTPARARAPDERPSCSRTAELRSGMVLVVHLAQPLAADVGVDLRGGDV